jgi:hypothetical protein
MIRADQLLRDKENSMDNYIFLTDEGYTFQPDSESDVPDIENLLAINKELLILFWSIGNTILSYQDKEDWGAKVIDNIAKKYF